MYSIHFSPLRQEYNIAKILEESNNDWRKLTPPSIISSLLHITSLLTCSLWGNHVRPPLSRIQTILREKFANQFSFCKWWAYLATIISKIFNSVAFHDQKWELENLQDVALLFLAVCKGAWLAAYRRSLRLQESIFFFLPLSYFFSTFKIKPITARL